MIRGSNQAVEISVVMPVRDAATHLEDQLQALSGQTFAGSWELIVADNEGAGTTADCVNRWRDRLPNMRLIDASARRGSYAARNVGTREAKGLLIAYCDADDIVAPGWLEGLVGNLEDSFMVTGPIDLGTLNPSAVVAWRGSTLWDKPLDWYRFLPVAMTCNFGMRRELFDAIGGFREMSSGSDIRFVWEAQLQGWKLEFSPAAVVHRREPQSWSAYLRRSYRYGTNQPELFKQFRAAGMPRSSLVRAACLWAFVLAGPLALVTPSWRFAWLDTAGLSAGRLVGSLRSRALYL
jgi:glycosyltransferase involved in cell wall biosynthesis